MTHPLASDPTVPAVLRKAFAHVRGRVILVMDDGSTTACNYISDKTRDSKLAEYRDIIAVHAARGYGFSDGRAAVSCHVETE